MTDADSPLRLIVEYPGECSTSASDSLASSSRPSSRTVRFRVVDVAGASEVAVAPPTAERSRAAVLVLTHALLAWGLYVSGTYSSASPPSAFFLACSFVSLAALWRVLCPPSPASVYEESILLVPGLGLQLESAWYASRSDALRVGAHPLRRQTRAFLTIDRVKRVLINEGISGCAVHFYLLIMLRDDEQPDTRSPSLNAPQPLQERECIVLPFERVHPRFPMLLEMYEGLTTILEQPRDLAGRP